MTMENTEEAAKSETAPTSPPAAAAESPPWSPPPPRPPPPSPSLSSSPSHEFSFTLSFHATKTFSGTASAAAAAVKLSKSSSSLLDFDHSPADDIFFNGHLLPLHFVSHLPSDISIDNADFHHPSQIGTEYLEASNTAAAAADVATSDNNGRSISKSFPLIWLQKWLKGNDGGEDRVEEKQRKKTLKKKAFDFAVLWKKYTSLVQSFHFLKYWKEKREIRRSSQFFFSGDGGLRRWHWQGGLSAPPSIRTSPANSGLLGTPPTTNFSSEELQNAIQAAIVHCKNSIAVENDD